MNAKGSTERAIPARKNPPRFESSFLQANSGRKQRNPVKKKQLPFTAGSLPIGEGGGFQKSRVINEGRETNQDLKIKAHREKGEGRP